MSSSAQERALREVKEIIRDLPTTGPYSASNLGRLKYIDRIVQDNDSASTYENVSINQALEDLALLALPADTAGALRAGKGGNDLALELVRRNLTEFDALAGVVYDSTEDERGADDGLRRLHGAFSLITELHSALVSAGIDVGRKDWATALTKKMPNLRRLRSAPWFEVALILKLVTEGSESGTGGAQSVPWSTPPTRTDIRIVKELYAVGDGAPAIRQQVLGVRLGLDVADQLEEMEIYDASTMTKQDTRDLQRLATLQLKEEEAAPSTVAPAGTKVLPKLSKYTKIYKLGGMIEIKKMISTLNALASNNGVGKSSSGLVKPKEYPTPDVEAGVAALDLEKVRLQATLDAVSQELDKISVEGQSGQLLADAKLAMETAKAAVAPDEGWQNRIDPNAAETLQGSLQGNRLAAFGSSGTGYATNEELVAQASGGAALYGLNIFPTVDDLMIKPYTPLLEPPTYVQMTGAVGNFEAHVWQTTDVETASSFHNISDSAGTSVARKVSTTKGGSASVSGYGASATASHSQTEENQTNEASTNSTDSSASSSTKTTTATVIEYIECPMKSFRIPMSRMRLSEDAYLTALEINSIRDAGEFLDTYGSHVSNGRQEMGGIFYSTMTLTSRKEESSAELLEAASSQSSKLKSKSSETTASAGGSYFGISAKVSASFGKATSVGSTSDSTSAEGQGNQSEKLQARYAQHIRCTGPRATTPETFAEALFSDNSSWAVTDRGPLEALVPVSRVVDNTIKLMDNDDPDKGSMQTSMNYISAAWRTRAKSWGAKRNNQIPVALVALYKTAFFPAQGVVQGLVRSVYNVLEFVQSPNLVQVWGVSEPSAELAGAGVASAIRQAANKASGGSGVSPLLHHLRVAQVQGYVEKVMAEKEKVNKAAYLELHPQEEDMLSTEVKDETWGQLSPLERFGRKGDSSEGASGTYFDPKYFDSLKPWEQGWIEKSSYFFKEGKEWANTDYEVFQREYFRAESPSTFLTELDLALRSPQNNEEGASIRVLSLDRANGDEEVADIKQLLKAVTEAARAMQGEDWTIFSKIWADDRNPEETDRVVEIIEDYIAAVREILSRAVDEISTTSAEERLTGAQVVLNEKESLAEGSYTAYEAQRTNTEDRTPAWTIRTEELRVEYEQALKAASHALELRDQAQTGRDKTQAAATRDQAANQSFITASETFKSTLNAIQDHKRSPAEEDEDEQAWSDELERLQEKHNLASEAFKSTEAKAKEAADYFRETVETVDRAVGVAQYLRNEARFVDNKRLTSLSYYKSQLPSVG